MSQNSFRLSQKHELITTFVTKLFQNSLKSLQKFFKSFPNFLKYLKKGQKQFIIPEFFRKYVTFRENMPEFQNNIFQKF